MFVHEEGKDVVFHCIWVCWIGSKKEGCCHDCVIGKPAIDNICLQSRLWLADAINVNEDYSVRGQPVSRSKDISESFQLWPQTPLAFFGLQLPPSSGDTSEYFLFQPPSSSPQRSCTLLPLWPLDRHPFWWPLRNLCLLQRKPRDLFGVHIFRYEVHSNVLRKLSKP